MGVGIEFFSSNKKNQGIQIGCPDLLWSGLRGSNSLPPPWQGGALPDELNPHMATWKRFELSTSAVTGQRSNQLNYQAIVVGTTGLEPVTLCL